MRPHLAPSSAASTAKSLRPRPSVWSKKADAVSVMWPRASLWTSVCCASGPRHSRPKARKPSAGTASAGGVPECPSIVARGQGAGLPRQRDRRARLRVPAPAAGNDACTETDGAGRSLTAHLVLAVGPARAAHGGANRAGGEAVSGLPDFGAMPGPGPLVSGHDAPSRGGRTGVLRAGVLARAGQRQRPVLFRLVFCFVSFARGLRADRAAVEAAFALEWSNGPTEGNVNRLNVNRLKLIKRQGYGRASFDLLKARVLPLAA